MKPRADGKFVGPRGGGPSALWPPEKLEELRLLISEGLGYTEIGRRMGPDYTKSAVLAKMQRLGVRTQRICRNCNERPAAPSLPYCAECMPIIKEAARNRHNARSHASRVGKPRDRTKELQARKAKRAAARAAEPAPRKRPNRPNRHQLVPSAPVGTKRRPISRSQFREMLARIAEEMAE